MQREYENQSLLVSVGRHGGANVLAALGDFAVNELDLACGVSIEDLGFEWEEAPAIVGLHVWEGTATDCPDPEGYESEVHWRGSWRPARVSDLARFGVAPLED